MHWQCGGTSTSIVPERAGSETGGSPVTGRLTAGNGTLLGAIPAARAAAAADPVPAAVAFAGRSVPVWSDVAVNTVRRVPVISARIMQQASSGSTIPSL